LFAKNESIKRDAKRKGGRRGKSGGYAENPKERTQVPPESFIHDSPHVVQKKLRMHLPLGVSRKKAFVHTPVKRPLKLASNTSRGETMVKTEDLSCREGAKKTTPTKKHDVF